MHGLVSLTPVAHADGALKLKARRVAQQLAVLFQEEHIPVFLHVKDVEKVADVIADAGGPIRGPHNLYAAVRGGATTLVAFRVTGGLLQADEALVAAATCDSHTHTCISLNL